MEFSQRLREAMVRMGYVASPSVLGHEFNLRQKVREHQLHWDERLNHTEREVVLAWP